MATILFAWELGGGLGHVLSMYPLVKGLTASGHRVIVAGKDIVAARRAFGSLPVELLPAPHSSIRPVVSKQLTFAHLLANVGFADVEFLKAHTQVWKSLYRLLDPDLIVFDHSPVAMLASLDSRARRAVWGAGFQMPPDAFPLPAFRADLALDWNPIKQLENKLLDNANQLLQDWGQPKLERLSQLYTRVDEAFLITYPDLDHYPNRGAAEYLGPINSGDEGGKDPVWPDQPGRKIFAYLKSFAELPKLLAALNESGQPTLVFMDGISADANSRFISRSLRFESERINIAKAAAGCDIAVTNAGLATAAMVLRAGKPMFLVPLTEEQGIVARLVQGHGAGLGTFMDRPETFAPRLKLVLEDPRYREGAARLSIRLNRIDLAASQREIMRRLQLLL